MTDKTESAAESRPLSPHLQVYRWPLSMAVSIAHRITGVGLALGTVILAWWLIAAAMGPDAYAVFESVAATWFGKLVLAGITFSLMFHLCNGVRHLIWDLGFGFSIKVSYLSGLGVIGAALLLTAAIAWVALRAMGTA